MREPSAADATSVRYLLLVLGDQLDPDSALLAEADRGQDLIWMAESVEEATHVWSHQARIAVFLSAMRHYRDARREDGWSVRYHGDDRDPLAASATPVASLGQALRDDLAGLSVQAVRVVLPGDHRVLEQLRAACRDAGVALDLLDDTHFFDTPTGFAEWANGRRQIRLEYYYRHLRRRFAVLMDGDQPAGGQWNYDQDNRQSFGRDGPGALPAPIAFAPDAITRGVLHAVVERHGSHPGELDAFDWPVTPAQARAALADFIDQRLAGFGPWQDALWAGEPWLYHSRLSVALNLKLLSPQEAVAAAVDAWRDGRAELASVEGFVRQILGWREYVRGIYWSDMPGYLAHNALNATEPLPAFFWTGETDMACLADTVSQTLRYGYAHHIQRLMITGLYALLHGVDPHAVHRWYLAVYVDAVEWVEAPNTIGMSQFADGGRMASKPYCASGRYIQRMSNYCASCRYRPEQRTGPKACPFTTLYWDFLIRHADALAGNPRMRMQLRNLQRLDAEQQAAIRAAADAHRRAVAGASPEPAGQR